MSVKRRFSTYYLTIVLAIGCWAGTDAQTMDNAEGILRDSLGVPIWRAGYRVNPTSYAELEDPKGTDISARYAYWDSDGLNSPFQGDGGDRFHITASGYGVQEGKDVFCATASFSTGTRRNTRWNDVCDLWMLYPYIVADEQGGDYLDETYRLSGGYSRFIGRHILGLRISYRGCVAHRDRDPRPKNTVSDLSINPGWSFRIGNKHTLGVFARYTYYKQHVSISVAEANRSYIFYLMRGMGLFDRMFSKGDSSLGRYYFSNAVSAGLQWEKKGRNAFDVTAGISYRDVHVEESDNRIPYKTARLTAELYAGYRRALGLSQFTLTLTGEMGQQKGRERTYERVTADQQTSVQVWRLLSETMRDKITFATANLRAEYLQSIGRSRYLRYGLDADYRTGEERFTNPQYHMRAAGIRAGADLGFHRRSDKGHGIDARLRAEHRLHTGCSIVAPDPSNELLVAQMLLPLYDYLNKDYTFLGAQAAYTVPIKGCDMRIQADGGYAFGKNETKKWNASLGLSVRL